MKKLILFLMCVFGFFQSQGQLRDHNFPFGNTAQNGMTITFTDSTRSINVTPRAFRFDFTNAALSDGEGKIILASNGFSIHGANGNYIPNGQGLSPGPYADIWNDIGMLIPQGALMLSLPEHDSTVYLFHVLFDIETDPAHVSDILLTEISTPDHTDSLPVVVDKNIPILIDSLFNGAISAVKHANGRDWWVMVPNYDFGGMHRMLLNPSGIHYIGFQNIASLEKDAVGEVCFSPDGTKYARNMLRGGLNDPDGIDLFDFDRCSGLFSNHRYHEENDSLGTWGVAFSSDSRYLYASRGIELMQYDTEAPTLATGRTVVATDDATSPLLPFFPYAFGTMQLAPDGKIYIRSVAGQDAIHEIVYPNRPGMEANIVQHAFLLPHYNNTMPRFPNFRLGPLEGSLCDTLGLVNFPLARFRADTMMNELDAVFVNNSDYEPTDFVWTFGDGQSSTDYEPVHTYPAPGVYRVCLVASNVYGSDTLCYNVAVGGEPVGTSETSVKETDILLFPNPVSDLLTIRSADYDYRELRIYATDGRLVLSQNWSVANRQRQVSVRGLPNGMYRLVLSGTGIPNTNTVFAVVR